jgi:hypothetical protein
MRVIVKCESANEEQLKNLFVGELFQFPASVEQNTYMVLDTDYGHPSRFRVLNLKSGYVYLYRDDTWIIPMDGELTVWRKK